MCPLSMGNFDETSSIWTGTVAWAVCGGVGGVGCVESSKHIWGGGGPNTPSIALLLPQGTIIKSLFWAK